MASREARIRRYEQRDDKPVRFAVAKASMEDLASANVRVYTSPIVLALWVALSAAFVQFMRWWPDTAQHGSWAYLRPVPAFAACALPILFLTDWLNRPSFEEATQTLFKRRDMVDIGQYYSPDRHGLSSLWVLEHGDHILGILAFDASPDATSQRSIDDPQSGQDQTSPSRSTAVIRHFWVEEPYRPTNIQDDLLVHALTQAFQADSGQRIREVRAEDSQLSPYVGRALRKQGFRPVQDTGNTRKVGVLGWSVTPVSLKRERWRAS